MRNISFPAVFSLSTLDGQNGFKMYDEKDTNYNYGYSVKPAGDLNKDGYDDIIIGTIDYTYSSVRSYIIFGQPKIDMNGFLSLSDLNGKNGFKIEGENSGVRFFGNTAADINQDGYDDLIVGTGDDSYVIFGHPKVGAGGLITLADLNGTNGFKIKAPISGGYSEPWVGSVGDVNGDGYPDLLISASLNSQPVCSYVVFGSSTLGRTGQILLSDLNGANGFKINIEIATADIVGVSTASGLDDIDGDGFSDFIIGNAWYNKNKGRCYVVFGGISVGSRGLIELAKLNGNDGFKLIADDEVGNYLSFGTSVAGIGDVNGDNFPDLLIGAPGYQYSSGSYDGQSYVIFGTKNLGNNGIMSVSNVNGSNGFRLRGEFNGYGSNTNLCCSGTSVSGAGDINGDGYADFQIAAKTYNSYLEQPGGSYVIFGGPKVGDSGLISLSKLDGVIGFKISGEISNSQEMSVSAAGDINGDGYPDLLLGDFGSLPYNAPINGRSYAVINFTSETSPTSATFSNIINLILGMSIAGVVALLLGCYYGIKKYRENKRDLPDFENSDNYFQLSVSSQDRKKSHPGRNFREKIRLDSKSHRRGLGNHSFDEKSSKLPLTQPGSDSVAASKGKLRENISENSSVLKPVVEYHSFNENKSPNLPSEQGYSNAQFIPDVCYANGSEDVVAKDQKEAITRYRKAAEQGNPDAQAVLGLCYAEGNGIPKDQKEAVTWYRKAAEQGLSTAQCSLGLCYAEGNGIPKDQKEAVTWYRKAAEQGLSIAQYSLGLCYAEGNGIPKDQKEAAVWYRKAAEQGDSHAQFNLGAYYTTGTGVSEDQKEAVTWYRKAAEQGQPSAQVMLGICYEIGEGVVEDKKEAVTWYRKAAEQGNPDAQAVLGKCYAEGNGIPKDQKESTAWYRKAAEQNNPSAQFYLGACYLRGEGVQQNQVEAFTWFKRAAAQGHAGAAQILSASSFLSSGSGTNSGQSPVANINIP